ncbi:hypothetical protein ACJ2A9_13735 [Anaerobacillus sp. MEB173]|uniref:hypothetical protein n=1 Tax=Anaerobacillus sp. MEB173 TaxID=3383345 RepID=UPI003F8E3059
MIKSITICEDTTADFKPITMTDRFTEKNHSITILVNLQVETESAIRFHWYISSDPDEPIVVYEIPIESEKKDISVTNTLGLQYLFNEDKLNIFQPWYVLIEYENEMSRVDFIVSESVEYGHHQTAIIQENFQSRYEWRV